MNDKKYWIWLANLNGFGHQRITALLDQYESAEAVYMLSSEQIDKLELGDNLKCTLKNKDLDYAEGIVSDCLEKNIDIITYAEEGYPKKLAYIYNPPLVLYKKGKDFDFDALPCLAIVGTREATVYGCKVAEEFGRDLSLNGIMVVSGMALGIDAAAHTGAIKAGCPTVAVLGTGVDVIYPYKHKELYEYIVDYGAVISEYPPGTKAFPANFPARNRIISGLTEAVLVVEADIKSGSLITADRTTEQGKDVFAIPNSIYAQKARGTNILIREGAYVATCTNDIVEHFISKYPEAIFKGKPKETIPNEKYIKNLNELSEDEKFLVSFIDEKPKYIDELIRKTGFPTGKINALITILTIKDIIYCVPGNAYALK